jgi:hypothetical protein
MDLLFGEVQRLYDMRGVCELGLGDRIRCNAMIPNCASSLCVSLMPDDTIGYLMKCGFNGILQHLMRFREPRMTSQPPFSKGPGFPRRARKGDKRVILENRASRRNSRFSRNIPST